MITEKWDEKLKSEINKDYFKNMMIKLKEEYKTKEILPSYDNIFKAFKLTDYDDVKIVILGQDPYPNKNHAMGLSFSVPEEAKIPRSLKNIYKEMNSDLKLRIPEKGNLEKWAKEGVLLLNSILTYGDESTKIGKISMWEQFTDEVIKELNKREKPIVFILWGNYAKEKAKYITNTNHYIISSCHPAPQSSNRGDFYGSKPFSKANNYLIRKKIKPVDFSLD